jgi:hypothetical protein
VVSDLMLAFNITPGSYTNYTSLSYALYPNPSSHAVQIFESGADKGIHTSYTSTSIFTIVYDGTTISYYVDNQLIPYQSTPTPGTPLYLDIAFRGTAGTRAYNVHFDRLLLGATGSTGATGATGPAASRVTASVTTVSLADAASGTYTITGFKGYALLSLQVDHGAWVTIYMTTAARSADSSRSITTDPTPGSGVIAESITSGAGASTTYFTPALIGYSAESPPTTNIPIKVYNNSGTTTTITVTLTLIKLEA